MQVDSVKKIYNLVKNSTIIGYGAYGVVFLYEDILFKMDRYLYQLFLKKEPSNLEYLEQINSVYYQNIFIPNIGKIAYFNEVRDKIKLTKLPQEVLYYQKTPSAIILPYHRKYRGFNFNKNIKLEKKAFAEISYNVLDALKELEEHGIYQLDLNFGQNILYNDNNVQLIDLDGIFLKIKESKYKKLVYQEFVAFLLSFKDFLYNDNINKEFNNFVKDDINTYSDSISVVKKMEKML